MKALHIRILVAEDDESTRQGMMELLKDEYPECTVFDASNGKEALDIFKRENAKIDLIITDNHMPILNGIGLTRQVRALKPDQKIVMISSGEKTDEIRGLHIKFHQKLSHIPVPRFLQSVFKHFDDPINWE